MLDWIILILSTISALIVTVYTFSAYAEKAPDILIRSKKLLKIASVAALILSLVLSACEITGLIKLSHIRYFSLWVFVVCLLVFVAKGLASKFTKTDTGKKHLSFLSKLMLIAMFLELFVFSFNSYKLMPKEYPFVTPDFEFSADEVKFDGEKYIIEGKKDGITANIKISDLNLPVGTLTLDLSSDTNQKTTVNISYSDDTTSYLRHHIANGEIINDNEKSRTFPINASGAIKDMHIEITAEPGETITLRSVQVNKPMGLKASVIRFLIIVLGVFAVYLLLNSNLLQQPFEKVEFDAKFLFVIVTFLFVTYSAFLICGKTGYIKSEFSTTKGNQITQELVDAFKNGQVSLIAEPSQELLELKNPYDSAARQGIDCLWDHVFFNGKYYSYYGIAPVIFLFLPYHLITGYYFSTPLAVLLFGGLGMIFLSLLYLEFIKKFHGKTPLNLVIGGLIMLQLASGVLYCFPTPLFYEIAQTSGFLCVTAGAYFMLKSNIIGDGKIKLRFLMLSSTFLALAVLCRPTLAVYSVVALIFIFVGLKKYLKNANAKKLKLFIKYAVASLLPFAIFGGLQMAYNYLRFGSPLDFGIQYSLTINDFTKTEFHVHLAAIGFFNFLFAFPEFSPNFPFFVSKVQTFSPNGFYYVATNTAIGLLFKVMPVLSLAYWRKAYKTSESKNKRTYAILLLALGIVAPFIIIASIWESGYGVRYGADFNWQIIITAYTILFVLFNRTQNEGVKRIITKLFTASVVISVILVTAELFSWQIFNRPSSEMQRILYSFGRIFEFWK